MQRDCTYSCTVNWTCANWSTCTNGNQTRTCTDQSACGTNSGKPIESQSCASEFDVNACNPFYNWQDGQTYTLTKDISSTITGCFQFNNKTNVTLNCNHLSITNGYSGSRDNTTGIAILQSSGIRIENCDVSLFGNGISITQSPMTIIIDSTIVSNPKNGIYLSDSESCAIQGNQLTNNTNAGLFLFNSKYAAITNNESNMNAYGFYEDLSNIDYQNNQIEFSGNKFGCLHTNTTKDLFGCGSTDYGSSQVSDSSTCASATITGCS
jgi:parallel beta-helix repeat protein